MRALRRHLRMSIAGLVAVVAAAALYACFRPEPEPHELLARYRDGSGYAALTIRRPADGTLFPPESVPPEFQWDDDTSTSNTWLVSIMFQDGQRPVNVITGQCQWRPGQGQWESIKQRSLEKEAQVTILGMKRRIATRILSAGQISISTSEDPVGSPLFYREVNLPFIDAVSVQRVLSRKDDSKHRYSSAEPIATHGFASQLLRDLSRFKA